MGRDVTNLTSSDEKSIALAGILLPVVILAIPLGLWRVIYRFTDWAALFLVPLALVLLIGFHRQLASFHCGRVHRTVADCRRTNRRKAI